MKTHSHPAIPIMLPILREIKQKYSSILLKIIKAGKIAIHGVHASLKLRNVKSHSHLIHVRKLHS